jgi:hypothetical protein
MGAVTQVLKDELTDYTDLCDNLLVVSMAMGETPLRVFALNRHAARTKAACRDRACAWLPSRHARRCWVILGDPTPVPWHGAVSELKDLR